MTWYSTAQGTHNFTRYTCSSNYPTPPDTTFTLYHQRGALPDENKGVLISNRRCGGTNYSGSAYSDDTENHYWKLTFTYRSTAERISGTGRTRFPG